MYEQVNEQIPPGRRAVIIIASLIALVAFIWFAAWLLFFRDASKPSQSGHKVQQSPARSGSSSNSGSTGSAGSQSGNSSSQNQHNSTNTSPAPTELANTGAGNVFIAPAAAFVVGTGFYYVRLRRKFTV